MGLCGYILFCVELSISFDFLLEHSFNCFLLKVFSYLVLHYGYVMIFGFIFVDANWLIGLYFL